MKKKVVFACIIFLVMAVFIFIPAPTSKLYIRIYFDEIQGNNCELYYAVDGMNAFSREQCITSAIDYNRKMVEFALEPSLEGHVTGLRLDLPGEPQLLCIKSITVSNAGVIKRQYNPCRFFAQDNITYSNDIDAISLATAKARAYFNAVSNDPYLILSDGLSRQIMDCYSHFTLTKLVVCVFLAGCFFLSKKKIFKEDFL